MTASPTIVLIVTITWAIVNLLCSVIGPKLDKHIPMVLRVMVAWDITELHTQSVFTINWLTSIGVASWAQLVLIDPPLSMLVANALFPLYMTLGFSTAIKIRQANKRKSKSSVASASDPLTSSPFSEKTGRQKRYGGVLVRHVSVLNMVSGTEEEGIAHDHSIISSLWDACLWGVMIYLLVTSSYYLAEFYGENDVQSVTAGACRFQSVHANATIYCGKFAWFDVEDGEPSMCKSMQVDAGTIAFNPALVSRNGQRFSMHAFEYADRVEPYLISETTISQLHVEVCMTFSISCNTATEGTRTVHVSKPLTIEASSAGSGVGGKRQKKNDNAQSPAVQTTHGDIPFWVLIRQVLSVLAYVIVFWVIVRKGKEEEDEEDLRAAMIDPNENEAVRMYEL